MWLRAVVVLSTALLGAAAGYALGGSKPLPPVDEDLRVPLAAALAKSAELSFRAKDTMAAAALASQALLHAEDPLARGVLIAAAERGAPRVVWRTGLTGGCTALLSLGEVVACAGLGGIALLDVTDGHVVKTLNTGPIGWQHELATLGPSLLVSAGDDHAVHLWSLETGEHLRALAHFEPSVVALASWPEHESVLAGLRDGRVIELPSGEERFRFEGTFVALASAKGVIAACTSNDARIQFSNAAEVLVNGPCHAIEAGVDRVLVSSGESIVEVKPSSVPRVVFRGAEHSTAIAANGDEPLFAGNESGEVRWFVNGALEGIWREAGPVTALAVVAERRIAVAPRGQSVAMISIPPKASQRSTERRASSEDPALARFNQTHASDVPALAMASAPDGGVTYSAGRDGIVHEWAGSDPVTIGSTMAVVTALAISPGAGKYLATGGPREVVVFERISRTLSARIPVDDGEVRPLTFIDEAHLVAGSHHAWEITSLR